MQKIIIIISSYILLLSVFLLANISLQNMFILSIIFIASNIMLFNIKLNDDVNIVKNNIKNIKPVQINENYTEYTFDDDIDTISFDVFKDDIEFIPFVEEDIVKPISQKIRNKTTQLTDNIIEKFKIDTFSHRGEIYNNVLYVLTHFKTTYKNELTECLYYIFNHYEELDIITKLQLGSYVIWKSYDQKQIDSVYTKVIEISGSNRYNNAERANAVDVLMRSNSTYYQKIAGNLLDRLRRVERNEIEEEELANIEREIREQPADRNFIRDAELRMGEQIRGRNSRIAQFDRPVEIVPQLQRENGQIQLRNLQQRQFNLQVNKNKEASIYNDTQNIHNHELNKQAMDIASVLVSSELLGKNTLNVENILENTYIDYELYKDKIKKSLNRIETDPAKFKNDMTIKLVYDKICQYIIKSKHKDELIKRLGDELVEMSGLCSTGHLTRLLNSIQGFDDTPENLKITMSFVDEIYANIQNFLNKELQNDTNTEQLLDDMISDIHHEKKRYNDFIAKKLNQKYKELKTEYDGLIDETTLFYNLEDSINKYTKDRNSVRYIMTKIDKDV